MLDSGLRPTAVRFGEIGCASSEQPPLNIVMPGLVPGIHVFAATNPGVDGRDKPGHDEWRE
jgi:hypothetical protein